MQGILHPIGRRHHPDVLYQSANFPRPRNLDLWAAETDDRWALSVERFSSRTACHEKSIYPLRRAAQRMFSRAIFGVRPGRWWWRREWRRWLWWRFGRRRCRFLLGRKHGRRRSARISGSPECGSRRDGGGGGIAWINRTSRQPEQRGSSTRNCPAVDRHHRSGRDARRCIRHCAGDESQQRQPDRANDRKCVYGGCRRCQWSGERRSRR
jgi:hypothetical protein